MFATRIYKIDLRFGAYFWHTTMAAQQEYEECYYVFGRKTMVAPQKKTQAPCVICGESEGACVVYGKSVRHPTQREYSEMNEWYNLSWDVYYYFDESPESWWRDFNNRQNNFNQRYGDVGIPGYSEDGLVDWGTEKLQEIKLEMEREHDYPDEFVDSAGNSGR